MKVLPREFYARNTVTVAKELLGKSLIRKNGTSVISGIICETEAYRHKDDPASHAYRGMTERNKAMFGEVGHAYVYFTYGMYFCVNAVAKSNNSDAGAVLIRALKPQKGVELMKKYRKTESISNLTDGPAKLTQALRINRDQYGVDLAKKSELYITEGIDLKLKIISDKRVGIKNGVDKRWNFKIDI